MEIQTSSKSVEKNMLTLKLERWDAYINFRQSRLQSKENYQDYRGATCNEKEKKSILHNFSKDITIFNVNAPNNRVSKYT